MLFSIHKKISSYFICNCLIFKRAENGIRTRDPQLGKLMLYRLSYFRITEYKVTPFFLFVKFSAAEKCAYPTIFFSDARFSGFFRLRPSAE